MAGAEMLNQPVADPMHNGDCEGSRVKGRSNAKNYQRMLMFLIRV